MGSQESEKVITGWAARDPSGILSPYSYSIRYSILLIITRLEILLCYLLTRSIISHVGTCECTRPL